MKDELSIELERLRREKRRLESRGKLEGLVGVCNQLGAVLFQMGRFEEALTEHLTEATTSEALSDTLGLAVASRKIGECHAELGQYTAALEHQRRHLELARTLGNLVEEQRAWATIGRTHLEEADTAGGHGDPGASLDAAEDAFHRSLNLCARLAPPEVSRVELARMRGRLYLNLGVVADNRGNTGGCEEFVERSLRVHRESNCIEDLVQTHHSMALIHKKHGRHEASLQQAEEALDACERLGSDALRATALALLGDLCLLTGRYERGRTALRRAYQLARAHSPENAAAVRHTLRTAVKLCRALEAIGGLAPDALEERLSLHERMGDLLCDAWCYGRAVDSYLSALECARALGRSGEQLAPLYVSLAATHADAREYGQALDYYALELECREGNAYEQCRTTLNMADCEERLGSSRQVLEEMYERALELARRGESAKLERRCLQALLTVLDGDRAGVVEARLQFLPPDEESEDEEDAGAVSDASSGLTEEEEEEGGTKTVCHVRRSSRGRGGTYRVTKNKKGETQLHLACIAGNVRLVKKLIEEGHPVNERDNCGWLPLHEAANQDFREVVRVLLANGARINDRGGAKCEGVTPLHDAATNGHTDMVRLLVEAGASLRSRTDRGETVVDCLRAWRRRAQGETAPELLLDCRNLETELEHRLMEETGRILPAAVDRESPPLGGDDGQRRCSQVSALLSEDRLLPASEDWLLDDIGPGNPPRSKRRRFDLAEPCRRRTDTDETTMVSRNRHVGNGTAPRRSGSLRQPRVTDHFDDWMDAEDDEDFFSAEVSGNKSPTTSHDDRKRRRHRSAGSWNGSDESCSRLDHDRTAIAPEVSPPSTYVPAPTTIVSTPAPSTLRIKVKVLDKLLLVPVPLGETVAWLIREAAQRYYALFGLRPVLLLSTRDGAFLSPEDAVDHVLGAGEEVMAQLQSYELLPLGQRYCDACSGSATAHANVRERLERSEADAVANLSDLRLTDVSVQPVLKALQCQANLKELNLSRNLFRTQGLQILGSAIQHLPGLRVLNLSNCDITDSDLGCLVLSLQTSKVIPKLETLNLGFNSLLEEGCEQLGRLLPLLANLSTLLLPSVLSDVGPSGWMPPPPHLSEVLAPVAPRLRYLDFSVNRLPSEQLRRVLLALRPATALAGLDLSGVSARPGRALDDVACRALAGLLEQESCALRELLLARCGLDQALVDILEPGLRRCRHLQTLDLTGNPKITREVVGSLSDVPELAHLKIVSSYETTTNRRRGPDTESFALDSESFARDSESLDDYLLTSTLA